MSHPLPDRLETYVDAVEEWISQIRENESRDSEEASQMGLIWSGAVFRTRAAGELRRQRSMSGP